MKTIRVTGKGNLIAPVAEDLERVWQEGKKKREEGSL